MGKKRTKSANAAVGAGSSSDGNLPLFNETSLSALTARIEKGLGNSKIPEETQKPVNKHRGHGKREKGPKLASNTKYSEPQRGTKRDANGNAKTGGMLSDKHRNATIQNEPTGYERTALLEEIIALGGTEEDLDLVADVTSDEEEAAPYTGVSLDKSFQKELANFVSGLGIETFKGSQSDESANEDAEDGWEAVSDSDVPGRVEGVKKETTPKTQNPGTAQVNVNRLVSTYSSSAITSSN